MEKKKYAVQAMTEVFKEKKTKAFTPRFLTFIIFSSNALNRKFIFYFIHFLLLTKC
jgi:hypothetical protein